MLYGTGSNPPAQNGLQRRILFSPIQMPLGKPYLSMASYVYREHDGVKRQTDGIILDHVP